MQTRAPPAVDGGCEASPWDAPCNEPSSRRDANSTERERVSGADVSDPGDPSTGRGGSNDKRTLARELVLIQVQTNHIASMQFVQARIWHAVNLLLGLPAAGVAAVAGGLALSSTSHAAIVGILALTSATIGSFQTVVGAQRRQANAERSGNSYLEVRNAARRLAELDLRDLSYEQARRRLEELAMRQDEINRSADPPSSIAIHYGRRYAERKLAHPLRPHGVTPGEAPAPPGSSSQ